MLKHCGMNQARISISVLCLAGLVLAAGTTRTQATVILPPGSTWEYTFTDPTSSSTWNTTTGGWTTGPAPFGSVKDYTAYDPDGYFNYKTYWAPDTTATLSDDLWVRVGVDLTGYDLGTIYYDLGVDNGYKLYANGNLVDFANAELYTSRWEYSGDIPLAYLHEGVNVFAVALEDHGGLTAFDMQLRGDLKSIPDAGSTLMLLGLASMLIAVSRKRA